MTEPIQPRCAVIAILGAPNAGKSTLLNRVVGAHLAAVTQKVQTTRASLRGIANREETQLVLIDTPGVFAPRRRLDRAMVAAAWSAIEGADEIIHLVDAAAFIDPKQVRTREDVDAIAEKLKRQGRVAMLVINKVDAVPRESLLETTATLVSRGGYSEVFMISALNGDGVDDLETKLYAGAPAGPWLFPEDQIADAPMRVLAAEITREKAMLRLHDELPYDLVVETETWEERKDGSVKIDQTIFVARESQRKIVIGAKGATIKAIGEAARKDLEADMERRVHLFLYVKVRENWAEERSLYRSLGLDWDA